MNHRSIPSLSSSISSQDTNQSPRTSSSSYSTYDVYTPPLINQRYNSMIIYEPISHTPNMDTCSSDNTTSSRRRWDDSQLEMELAEDDLIQHKRRHSSLKHLSETFNKTKNSLKHKDHKFKRSLKKIYHWFKL